jgi:hypothetical protein
VVEESSIFIFLQKREKITSIHEALFLLLAKCPRVASKFKKIAVSESNLTQLLLNMKMCWFFYCMVTNFLLHLSTPCITFMKPIYILYVSTIKMKFRDGLTSKQGRQQTYVIPQGLTCSDSERAVLLHLITYERLTLQRT